MKRNITLIGFLIIVFFYGMLTFRNDWFPRPQIRKLQDYFSPPPVTDTPPIANIDKILTQYTSGTPVYINRSYCDTIGDPRLDNTYIIQIPRHINTPIEIELYRKVKIYRLLTNSNDNNIFNDWTPTNIKVDVRGYTCVFTTVISKTFPPGKISLDPGGPTAASPIIIQVLSDSSTILPLTILNRNSLITTKPKLH
jgi:hypothetical protein